MPIYSCFFSGYSFSVFIVFSWKQLEDGGRCGDGRGEGFFERFAKLENTPSDSVIFMLDYFDTAPV